MTGTHLYFYFTCKFSKMLLEDFIKRHWIYLVCKINCWRLIKKLFFDDKILNFCIIRHVCDKKFCTPSLFSELFARSLWKVLFLFPGTIWSREWNIPRENPLLFTVRPFARNRTLKWLSTIYRAGERVPRRLQ